MNDFKKSSEHQQLLESKMTNITEEKTLNNINKDTSIAVNVGSIVTFSLLEHETNESEICTLKLVNHSKSYKNEISLDSPIGGKIHKTHIGDTITYTLMSNTFTATILNIETAV